jgi:hypothetical protein
MNRENGSFIQKWVSWTGENGQHDNGYIAQLLIDNGPLGMSWQMTVDQSIRKTDVEVCDWG